MLICVQAAHIYDKLVLSDYHILQYLVLCGSYHQSNLQRQENWPELKVLDHLVEANF